MIGRLTRFIKMYFNRTFLFLIISFTSLFADQADSVKAKIEPVQVTAGENSKEFIYVMKLFDGTADSIKILNPLNNIIVVKSIEVGGQQFFLSNSNKRPKEPGYASWFYNSIDNSLIITTDTSQISDSLKITFSQNIPVKAKNNNNYESVYDDLSDATNAATSINDGWAVSIIPGSVANISIENKAGGDGLIISDSTITTDDTINLFAIARDQYSNYIENYNATWTVINDIGTLSQSSSVSNVIFDATKPGAGSIRASGDGLASSTGVITITNGALAKLIIRDGTNGGGVEVADISLTTDENILLYAAGYDADDNYLGDISASWLSTGTLDQVSVDQKKFVHF